ncbi:MAG: Nif3-like dinuclear metal center hexameric protein [Anaerolineae bacterium]|nr:Nif3-like dinuclear metal center hexameric protein [Anaerolineae bacterium]
MKQADLVQHLDSFFGIEAFDESVHWKPRFSEKDLNTFEQYALESFRAGTWNGLMLNNTEQIDRVYTIVFPTQDVIDTIIAKEVARGAPGAMIFAHHLLNYNQDKHQYHLISEDQLEELAEHQISYYLCHAPLDCHVEVSTASALANMLGLREQKRFAPYYGGLAAVYGVVGKLVTFQHFAARLAKVTDVDHLRYDQVRHNGRPVQRVAVVPGHATDGELLRQAAELGCDTYVTGQWWYYADHAESEARREIVRDLVGELDMNLLGASRYASEMVVMRDQVPGLFRAQGVDSEFVPQDDPWA